MRSDKTRTRSPDPTSHEPPPRLVSQLQRVVTLGADRASIMASEIRRHDLTDLIRTALEEDSADLTSRVDAVIERLTLACRGQPGDNAYAALILFGLERGYQRRPLKRRIEAAASNVGQSPSYFERRGRRALVIAVLTEYIRIATPVPVATATQYMSVRTPWRLDHDNTAFHEERVEVETFIGREGRLPFETVWRRTLNLRDSGAAEFIIRTTNDVNARLVPIGDLIALDGPHGLDRNGRQVWRATFNQTPRINDTIQVSYRKIFDGLPRDEATSGYIAAKITGEKPTGSARIVADFTRAFEMPRLALRFGQPGGDLPKLTGIRTRIELIRNRLQFDLAAGDTKTGHSYGLYWWYEYDRVVPEEWNGAFA